MTFASRPRAPKSKAKESEAPPWPVLGYDLMSTSQHDSFLRDSAKKFRHHTIVYSSGAVGSKIFIGSFPSRTRVTPLPAHRVGLFGTIVEGWGEPTLLERFSWLDAYAEELQLRETDEALQELVQVRQAAENNLATIRRCQEALTRSLAAKHEPITLLGSSSSQAQTQDIDTSHLEALQDNWDEEGAPAPTAEAIRGGARLADWARTEDLSVELDADVVGGVDVYITGVPGRRAWIVIRNTGVRTVVFRLGDETKHSNFHEDLLPGIKDFLQGKNGPP